MRPSKVFKFFNGVHHGALQSQALFILLILDMLISMILIEIVYSYTDGRTDFLRLSFNTIFHHLQYLFLFLSTRVLSLTK